MTNEEAIKELLFAKRHVSEDSDVDNALDLAINALGAIDQIKWECDIAIEQLKDLGYSLGEKPRTGGDMVSRQQAIDALWKALYEYEDKTEKQFQDSDELNLSDWMLHRIFVQNMSDIDRQTILQLPSAEPKTFTVIDTKTGREADTYNIALKEEWAKGLCYCDIDMFVIGEDGTLMLIDDCGKCAYCPQGRFEVKWNE